MHVSFFHEPSYLPVREFYTITMNLLNNSLIRLSHHHCRYKLFGRVSDGHRTMADCVSQHLRAQGKALVSAANSSSGNMVDADGNPIAGPSNGTGMSWLTFL